jgi:hypothetical protein
MDSNMWVEIREVGVMVWIEFVRFRVGKRGACCGQLTWRNLPKDINLSQNDCENHESRLTVNVWIA